MATMPNRGLGAGRSSSEHRTGSSDRRFWSQFPDRIEIGDHLAHEAWGHGFATELAAGVVQYGFAVLGLDRIIAVASPDNLASRRVLEKSGLTGQ